MKTAVVTLQGQDFVVSASAEPVLLVHLKQLQRATRWHPAAYRQNVEALRDVLLTESGKTVSKAKLVQAIQLVGVPERKAMGESSLPRIPWLTEAINAVRRQLKAHHRPVHAWRHTFWVVVAAVAAFFAVGYGYAALQAVTSVDAQKSGWVATQTSIGPVRSWTDAHYLANAWPYNWSAYLLSGGLFLLISVLAFRLRQKGRGAPYGIIIFACLCFNVAIWQTQRINTVPPGAQAMSNQRVEPLAPQLAYLQQCGDEIPYAFDSQTNGMLFRHLRDQGFLLATPIPTRMSDGTLGTSELCHQYDTLRAKHAKQDIVLQLYAQAADGTPRVYDFSDIQNADVTSSYGLFVKP
jgi:hypothetical protein